MAKRWVEAGGAFQVPFMAVGSKVLEGKPPDPCPQCAHVPLRYYFHEFNRSRRQGTLWVWCSNCRTSCHLPRVTPRGTMPKDPFVGLGLEDFARLETESGEPLLGRLDRMWDEGVLCAGGGGKARG